MWGGGGGVPSPRSCGGAGRMTGLPESILPTLVYMGLLQVQRSVERVVDAPEVAHGTDARARGVVGI